VLDLAWATYLGALVLLSVYGGHRLFLTVQYWRVRRARAAPLPLPLPAALPVITVQLPLFNERYVAERLIDRVTELDWPRDLLQIQVLDDSTDDTFDICRRKVEALRRAGHDIEHLHRVQRTGFKAGALEAGLGSARGQLVLILDADFLPPRDLLRRTVGHFEDPGVGMVQVRWGHLNRGQSLLTRIQALLLDGHFVIEQTARERSGRLFNFNGTAGLWRRETIIDAGGWQHDTLTEDLDLSYRALLRGWRFVYLVDEVAPAELPADMNAFKSQQFRWAKGSVEVARKLLPQILRSRLRAAAKLEACFHLTQNVPYLLTLLLLLCAGPALVLRPGSTGEMLWLHLPLLGATAATFGAYMVVSQRALGHGLWRTILLLPALVAVIAGISVNQARAVLEGALGQASEFVRTPKHGSTDGQSRWRRKRYRGARSLVSLAEAGLALYFAIFLLLACLGGLWSCAASMALFATGFAYVSARSATR
jgi:cellulose synthase/poly-beta-1,6-N-acetylglucosamine synthase-like glycosyltransferase